MQFSLLDCEMNDTYEGMNFTHLTQLMMLHYRTSSKSNHRKCMWTQLQLIMLTTK